MLPATRLGLILECTTLLRNAPTGEKTASSLLDLPVDQITPELEPQFMEQLGGHLAQNPEALTEMLAKHASAWYAGYTSTLSRYNVDPDKMVKAAQAVSPYFSGAEAMRGGARAGGAFLRQQAMQGMPEDNRIVGNTSDATSWLLNKIKPGLGDGYAGMAADMGLYVLPGVGTIRTAVDAGSDFINMFGKGLNWKQRLGYGASGLFNSAMTAADLMTLGAGGTAVRALKAGGKLLSKGGKLGKLGKGLTSAGRGLQKGRIATSRGLKTMMDAGKWYSKPTGLLRRGTDFGNRTRKASLSKAQEGAGKGIKGWMKRRALGAGDMGKNMVGGIAANAPFIAGIGYAQNAINSPGVPNPNVNSGGGPGDYGGGPGYYGSQNSAQNFRGSSLGSGVQGLSRYSAGQRF